MITFARFFMFALMTILSTILVGVPLVFGIALAQNGMSPSSALFCIGLTTLGLVGLAALAASPSGDSITHLFLPTRKPSLREETRLKPILERLQKFYRDKYGNDIAAKLTVMDMPHINGMAIGKETVAVSTGLLKVGSDDEITAVIAHELGHLHHKDGYFGIALLVVGLPVMTVANIVGTALELSTDKVKNFGKGRKDYADNMFETAMLVIFFAAMAFLTVLAFFIWIVRSLNKVTAWPIEYRADRFACDMGYGEGLVELLERIEDEDVRGATGFLKKYAYSHPPTALRIDRLERMLGVTK